MVIGVQMMSSCESDGKRLDQPGGAPPKEGSNQARNQKIEKSPDPLLKSMADVGSHDSKRGNRH